MKEQGKQEKPIFFLLFFSFLQYVMFRDSKGHLFMSDDTLRAYKAGILPVIKARVSSVSVSREKWRKMLLIVALLVVIHQKIGEL